MMPHPAATMSGPGVALTTPALANTALGGVDVPHGTCLTCHRSTVLPARSLCRPCYEVHRRSGTLDAVTPKATAVERFWTKIQRDADGCWLWTANINNGGYGTFHNGDRDVKAHRYAYELMVGPIPEGLVIDHLCRVRRCVNPGHLDPVTAEENVRRGEGPTAVNARKARCHRGHPLDYVDSQGARQCSTCRTVRSAA